MIWCSPNVTILTFTTCAASSFLEVHPGEQSASKKQNKTYLYVHGGMYRTRSCRRGQHGPLTCFSLKERLPLVRTFWLCLIIMKFFVRLFSLLLVLAWGFNLVLFFTNSLRSVRPAYRPKNAKHPVKALCEEIGINVFFKPLLLLCGSPCQFLVSYGASQYPSGSAVPLWKIKWNSSPVLFLTRSLI